MLLRNFYRIIKMKLLLMSIVKNKEGSRRCFAMSVIGWIVLTFSIVCFLPFFIWLSASYLRYGDQSKRKNNYWLFLMLAGLLNSLNLFLFKIQDTYFLAVIVIIILMFSLYMFLIVRKDKRKVSFR